MFSLITAQALTAPFTTTGHTEETQTLTPERRDTALFNFLFIRSGNWLWGASGLPFFKRKEF
jgi:hypothetical protein